MEIVKDIQKLSLRTNEIAVVPNENEIRAAKEKMEQFMKENDLYFITAPQLDFTYRMFALKFNDEVKFFVNPMITHQEGIHVSIETDPSLDSRTFLVTRHDKIDLNYQTIFGTYESNQFDGVAADYIQHEIQVLDGVFISDLGLEVFDDFLSASKEDQDEVISAYLESMKAKKETLQAEVDADPKAKEMQEAIEFMAAGARGEIEFDRPQMPLVGRKERRKLKRQGLLDKLVDPITHRWKPLTQQGQVIDKKEEDGN